MNKLLEQLRTVPAFNDFEKAVKENLVDDNCYLEKFIPERSGFYEEDDDDGSVSGCYCTMSRDSAIEEAIDELLDDRDGDFENFVIDSLEEDAIDLIRALIKELRREGSV